MSLGTPIRRRDSQESDRGAFLGNLDFEGVTSIARNQDSRFGRVLISVENGMVSCVSRIGEKRIVREIALAELRPHRVRAQGEAIAVLPDWTLGFAMVCAWVTHWLVPFLDLIEDRTIPVGSVNVAATDAARRKRPRPILRGE